MADWAGVWRLKNGQYAKVTKISTFIYCQGADVWTGYTNPGGECLTHYWVNGNSVISPQFDLISKRRGAEEDWPDLEKKEEQC